jgi:hypothetical protein
LPLDPNIFNAESNSKVSWVNYYVFHHKTIIITCLMYKVMVDAENKVTAGGARTASRPRIARGFVPSVHHKDYL